jgi:hypothetical protein
MDKKMKGIRWGVIILVMIFLQGRSCRQWYDGLKLVQTSECSKLQDNEREKCLQDAGISYDQYQRERQEPLKKDQQ